MIAYLQTKKVEINSVMLTGGVSCNKDFQTIISWLTKKSKLPLLVAPPQLCTDNAAMVAWMGHELIRAGQDVDIR